MRQTFQSKPSSHTSGWRTKTSLSYPRSHGLYFQDENLEVFVTGLQGEDKRPSALLDKVVAIRLQEVPIGLIPSNPLTPTSAPPATRKGNERAPYPQPATYSGSDIGETITETHSFHRASPRGKPANPATSSTSVPPGRLSPKPRSPPISRPGSPNHLSEQGEDDFGEPTRVSCYNSEEKPRILDFFRGRVPQQQHSEKRDMWLSHWILIRNFLQISLQMF